MAELSRDVDRHASLITGRAVLLDVPLHGNVGDHLIWQGERAFLARNGIRLSGQFAMDNMARRARRLLDECDTICFHGGGNFGDIWPAQQQFREDIIRRFPAKRIVIFPQTVHYLDVAGLRRSCSILQEHPDLHILARDPASRDALAGEGIRNVILSPDMAHALWGAVATTAPAAGGDLYVLRNDREQGRLPPDVSTRLDAAFDWDDLRFGGTKALYELGMRLVWRDGRHGNILPATPVWNVVSRHLIRRAVDVFSHHDRIVTNRLHAMILGALLGKRVRACDNSYGKVWSYLDCWLAGLPPIAKAD